MRLSYHPNISISSWSSSIPQHPKPTPRFHLPPKTPFLIPLCISITRPFPHSPCKATSHEHHHQLHTHTQPTKQPKDESFWAAVSLIVGTAVGPGMLGLPSATIRSGPLPSTAAIVLSWLYVVFSIILVAELSFAAMRAGDLQEVSFTALATDALGPEFGAFVAVVYACLSFSLLIACVSGIGSLIVQQFPAVNLVLAHAIVPCFVGIVIKFWPFEAIDSINRMLCALMLVSIMALVVFGLSVGKSCLLGSLSYASWSPEVILPAIPVTVLTLGFHVITPFVCKLLGNSIYETRKAILVGGFVPLAMVLSWNLVVLGLAGSGNGGVVGCGDPIKLLLSVNSSALPAVQGFAFAALSTSLIGYAVSFPKQLEDTVKLIVERFGPEDVNTSEVFSFLDGGRAGVAAYLRGNAGASGQACFGGRKSWKLLNRLKEEDKMNGINGEHQKDYNSNSSIVMWIVIVVPIFIASFFRSVFSKALDFAGVYANCFLFGVLPPAMAWIHRSRQRHRSPYHKEDLLPGGNGVLLVLFAIAVMLGIWH